MEYLQLHSSFHGMDSSPSRTLFTKHHHLTSLDAFFNIMKGENAIERIVHGDTRGRGTLGVLLRWRCLRQCPFFAVLARGKSA